MMKKYLLAIALSFLASQAWAQKTIDQLSAGSALGGTEQLPMFQGSNPSVTTTPNALKTYIAPTGANPSGTAGPAAVNGSAATFLRSDGAPAVQKGSASQFGIVEVDGTTITASGGVISSVGGSGVTSVATGCQATGGTITTTGTISTQETITALTGTNPAIVGGYCGGIENLNNGSNQIPTIAVAGSGLFVQGWFTDLCNIGAGTQTITPATGTIGGASTYVLAAGTAAAPQCVRIISDAANTNYVLAFPPGAGGTVTASSTTTFTNKTLTSSTNSLGGVTAAFGSDAKGDIYTNGGTSNVITRLAIGSTNNCLIVTSGLPAWAACPAGTITANSTATSGFSAGNIAYSDGSLIQASGALVTSGGVITSPATGSAGAPNFVGSAAGSTTGFYFPAAAGEMGFSSSGSAKLDYGITTASTWSMNGNLTFTGATVITGGTYTAAAGTNILVNTPARSSGSAAGNVSITGGNNTQGAGGGAGGSIVITAGTSTSGTAGTI